MIDNIHHQAQVVVNMSEFGKALWVVTETYELYAYLLSFDTKLFARLRKLL
jgi:hypothetical protein